MLQTKVVEKIEINILCIRTLFENRAVYEIMYEYIVELGGSQVTIWRMHSIEFWITKVTNTHSEYV